MPLPAALAAAVRAIVAGRPSSEHVEAVSPARPDAHASSRAVSGKRRAGRRSRKKRPRSPSHGVAEPVLLSRAGDEASARQRHGLQGVPKRLRVPKAEGQPSNEAPLPPLLPASRPSPAVALVPGRVTGSSRQVDQGKKARKKRPFHPDSALTLTSVSQQNPGKAQLSSPSAKKMRVLSPSHAVTAGTLVESDNVPITPPQQRSRASKPSKGSPEKRQHGSMTKTPPSSLAGDGGGDGDGPGSRGDAAARAPLRGRAFPFVLDTDDARAIDAASAADQAGEALALQRVPQTVERDVGAALQRVLDINPQLYRRVPSQPGDERSRGTDDDSVDAAAPSVVAPSVAAPSVVPGPVVHHQAGKRKLKQQQQKEKNVKKQAAAATKKKEKQTEAAAASKKKQVEAAAASKKQTEAAAASKKKQVEAAAASMKKQVEAAAASKKQEEAAAASKKKQEEAAAASKKKQEEAAAASKKQEEAAAASKKKQKEDSMKKKQEAAAAASARKKQAETAEKQGSAAVAAAAAAAAAMKQRKEEAAAKKKFDEEAAAAAAAVEKRLKKAAAAAKKKQADQEQGSEESDISTSDNSDDEMFKTLQAEKLAQRAKARQERLSLQKEHEQEESQRAAQATWRRPGSAAYDKAVASAFDNEDTRGARGGASSPSRTQSSADARHDARQRRIDTARQIVLGATGQHALSLELVMNPMIPLALSSSYQDFLSPAAEQQLKEDIRNHVPLATIVSRYRLVCAPRGLLDHLEKERLRAMGDPVITMAQRYNWCDRLRRRYLGDEIEVLRKDRVRETRGQYWSRDLSTLVMAQAMLRFAPVSHLTEQERQYRKAALNAADGVTLTSFTRSGRGPAAKVMKSPGDTAAAVPRESSASAGSDAASTASRRARSASAGSDAASASSRRTRSASVGSDAMSATSRRTRSASPGSDAASTASRRARSASAGSGASSRHVMSAGKPAALPTPDYSGKPGALDSTVGYSGPLLLHRLRKAYFHVPPIRHNVLCLVRAMCYTRQLPKLEPESILLSSSSISTLLQQPSRFRTEAVATAASVHAPALTKRAAYLYAATNVGAHVSALLPELPELAKAETISDFLTTFVGVPTEDGQGVAERAWFHLRSGFDLHVELSFYVSQLLSYLASEPDQVPDWCLVLQRTFASLTDLAATAIVSEPVPLGAGRCPVCTTCRCRLAFDVFAPLPPVFACRTCVRFTCRQCVPQGTQLHDWVCRVCAAGGDGLTDVELSDPLSTNTDKIVEVRYQLLELHIPERIAQRTNLPLREIIGFADAGELAPFHPVTQLPELPLSLLARHSNHMCGGEVLLLSSSLKARLRDFVATDLPTLALHDPRRVVCVFKPGTTIWAILPSAKQMDASPEALRKLVAADYAARRQQPNPVVASSRRAADAAASGGGDGGGGDDDGGGDGGGGDDDAHVMSAASSASRDATATPSTSITTTISAVHRASIRSSETSDGSAGDGNAQADGDRSGHVSTHVTSVSPGGVAAAESLVRAATSSTGGSKLDRLAIAAVESLPATPNDSGDDGATTPPAFPANESARAASDASAPNVVPVVASAAAEAALSRLAVIGSNDRFLLLQLSRAASLTPLHTLRLIACTPRLRCCWELARLQYERWSLSVVTREMISEMRSTADDSIAHPEKLPATESTVLAVHVSALYLAASRSSPSLLARFLATFSRHYPSVAVSSPLVMRFPSANATEAPMLPLLEPLSTSEHQYLMNSLDDIDAAALVLGRPPIELLALLRSVMSQADVDAVIDKLREKRLAAHPDLAAATTRQLTNTKSNRLWTRADQIHTQDLLGRRLVPMPLWSTELRRSPVFVYARIARSLELRTMISPRELAGFRQYIIACGASLDSIRDMEMDAIAERSSVHPDDRATMLANRSWAFAEQADTREVIAEPSVLLGDPAPMVADDWATESEEDEPAAGSGSGPARSKLSRSPKAKQKHARAPKSSKELIERLGQTTRSLSFAARRQMLTHVFSGNQSHVAAYLEGDVQVASNHAWLPNQDDLILQGVAAGLRANDVPSARSAAVILAGGALAPRSAAQILARGRYLLQSQQQ